MYSYSKVWNFNVFGFQETWLPPHHLNRKKMGWSKFIDDKCQSTVMRDCANAPWLILVYSYTDAHTKLPGRGYPNMVHFYLFEKGSSHEWVWNVQSWICLYSINTKSVDWLMSRFPRNYALYPYTVFTIRLNIQKLRVLNFFILNPMLKTPHESNHLLQRYSRLNQSTL